MPNRITQLFPQELETHEDGEIPHGWERAKLGEHFQAIRGVSYKGSDLHETGTPLHNLNSVFEGGGYKHEGIKYYSGPYAERHLVQPGDVVVANTEQGHDRLLIGYAALIPRRSKRGVVSHHLYRLTLKQDSPLTSRFLYYLLNSPRMQESQTLAALRDALLPKLISGELRVKDAERIVGAAV